MTDRDTIRAAFDRLRPMTDPRGHALLDALEGVCIEAAILPERLLERLDRLILDENSNVVPLDTHSRRA